MTRREFEAIAKAFAIQRAAWIGSGQGAVKARYAIDRTARSVAYVLAESNPRFDRHRFLIAARGGAPEETGR